MSSDVLAVSGERYAGAARLIAVYGGSAMARSSSEYQSAYDLGRLLVEEGFAPITGGYLGAMEAVSRGARDAGGEAIGLTLRIFEKKGIEPNPWLTAKVPCSSLFDRLEHFASRACGFVVLPGGVGTLGEFAVTWNLLQIGAIRRRPLVLVGNCWARVMEAIYNELYVGPRELELVSMVNTAAEAVAVLKQSR